MRFFLPVLLSVASLQSAAQMKQEELLPYLHGYKTEMSKEYLAALPNGQAGSKVATLINLRGVDVTMEEAKANFEKGWLQRSFPSFDLHQKDVLRQDTVLGLPAWTIRKELSIKGSVAYQACYFFAAAGELVQGFSFTSRLPIDPELATGVISLMRSGTIPDSLFSHPDDKVLPFVGRRIEVGNVCQWTGTNTMLCPNNGELNWSMHPSREEAVRFNEAQMAENLDLSMFKDVTATAVNIVFEGKKVEAVRKNFILKGLKGMLAKRQEGSRDLIVYYVTAPVRGVWVSCVLSHWTSDRVVAETGVPPLLNEVMSLK